MNLFKAIQKEDLKGVEKAISIGADINERDESGFTPLHMAAMILDEKISCHIIRILLDHDSPEIVEFFYPQTMI